MTLSEDRTSPPDALAVISRINKIGQRVTGRAYLRAMVEHIARVLDLAYVFVGRAVGERHDDIETLELWAGGQIADNFHYGLTGTPCHEVFTGNRVCIHTGGVAAQFPEDVLLAQMSVEAYMGAPITLPGGELVGLLVALDTKPRHDTALLEVVLEFFAGRAGAELERQLAEDRMMAIQDELTRQVDARTEELRAAHVHLIELARRAGMADIASSVLHSVGNLLTSAIVASDELTRTLSDDTVETLVAVNQLVARHATTLGAWLTTDPKGQKVPELYHQLAIQLQAERELTRRAQTTIRRQLALVARVVENQQGFAATVTAPRRVDVAHLISDACAIHEAALRRGGVEVVCSGPDPQLALAEPLRLTQVLDNLIRNAIDAMAGAPVRRLAITWESAGDAVVIRVGDTGPGIAPDLRSRLFGLGVAGRPDGHGIGLHSSRVFMTEMGGTLDLEPTAPGSGARFVIHMRVAAE